MTDVECVTVVLPDTASVLVIVVMVEEEGD